MGAVYKGLVLLGKLKIFRTGQICQLAPLKADMVLFAEIRNFSAGMVFQRIKPIMGQAENKSTVNGNPIALNCPDHVGIKVLNRFPAFLNGRDDIFADKFQVVQIQGFKSDEKMGGARFSKLFQRSGLWATSMDIWAA